jgi:hypothetical protein
VQAFQLLAEILVLVLELAVDPTRLEDGLRLPLQPLVVEEEQTIE